MSGEPEIESIYSDEYRRINVAGVVGGILVGGFEIAVYSEERRVDRVVQTQPLSPNRMKVRRTIEANLLLDPMQAKSIHEWLGQQIAKYEQIFGRIPSDEDIQRRSQA